MNKTAQTLLLMALSSILSGNLAGASSTSSPISIPAFTAYSEPDPYGMDFSDKGISNWKSSSNKAVWYLYFKHTSKIDISVNLHLPEKANWVGQLSMDEQHLNKLIVGSDTSLQKMQFGTFTVNTPGYHRIVLSSTDEHNKVYPEIFSLDIQGIDSEDVHFNSDERKNAASVHLSYPIENDSKITRFYNELTVKTDPLWTYYMACGFRRGYFGIQVNSPTERRIIFSVWDSGSEAVDRSKVAPVDRVQLIVKGRNVVAESFGNEGTGGHSHLIYHWKKNQTYRFMVTVKPEGTTTTYSGYFWFPESRTWGLIASFKAPRDGNYLSGLYSFNENFDGANGQMLRESSFGNEWVYTSKNEWKELVHAKFSHDPTGKVQRKDYDAAVKLDQFTLLNGGFLNGHIKYGDILVRPSHTSPPHYAQDFKAK